DDAARAAWRHGTHHGVGGIQHRVAGGSDVLHDHALEYRQIFHGGDVVESQVVPGADVRHHGHLAAVEAKSLAQHAAARGFKYGSIHVGVHQHAASAFWATAVTAVDLLAVHVHAIGVGHAHAQRAAGHQVSNQARGGGLAVGAGHRHHGYAAVIAMGKQVRDDGLADRAALAKGWRQVHAQPRGRVDLHDAAMLLTHRPKHALAHHIHPAHMQAHHARRGDGVGSDFRVHVIGDVGGGTARAEVGVVAQHHATAFCWHRLRRQSLRVQARHGDFVETDFGQRRAVSFTTPGVGVDPIHQFAHAVDTVADHMGRVPPGCRDQLVADHQQAEIVAGEVFFDHHLTHFGGSAKSDLQVLAIGDVDRYPLALIAIARLHDDR